MENQHIEFIPEEEALNAEEVSEDSEIAKEESSQQQVEQQQAEPQNGYSATNAGLDEFINTATLTKEDEREQQRKEAVESAKMTKEQAGELAVKGVVEVVKMAKQYTGKDLKISKGQLVICSTLCVPAVMKYAPTVISFIENMGDNLDDDSIIPECLAAGAVLGVGGSLWYQSRKIDKANASEKENAGGKKESEAA